VIPRYERSHPHQCTDQTLSSWVARLKRIFLIFPGTKPVTLGRPIQDNA
jgi:hypothetical protein